MAPDSRPPRGREEAFRILLRVETTDAYASLLLRDLPAQIEPRERALAHELVLGGLRWQGLVDHALAQFSRRAIDDLDPPVRVALRLGAFQILRLTRIPPSAAVDESVRLAKRAADRSAAGFVNGVLRALCRGTPRFPGPGTEVAERLAVCTSHPAWMVARRLRRMGEAEAEKSLVADNRPAPTTLRANRLRGGRDALRDELRELGIPAVPGRWSPDALRLGGGPPPADLFRSGAFYMQDEASQLVAGLVDPRGGERILDLCAAPGGKATDLAARLGGDGAVLAADRHPGRLRLVRENAGRLGTPGLQLLAQDGSMPALRPASFHRVLLDAPCSGTGTLRRHPEIRWRLRESQLEDLANRQQGLLSAAAELVRPGGVLVYSVCSLEPEEGPELVTAFLDGRPGFNPMDPADGAEPPPEDLVSRNPPGPHLRTLPHRHDVDGFFAVALRRGT